MKCAGLPRSINVENGLLGLLKFIPKADLYTLGRHTRYKRASRHAQLSLLSSDDDDTCPRTTGSCHSTTHTGQPSRFW